jgi:hypothetical protein
MTWHKRQPKIHNKYEKMLSDKLCMYIRGRNIRSFSDKETNFVDDLAKKWCHGLFLKLLRSIKITDWSIKDKLCAEISHLFNPMGKINSWARHLRKAWKRHFFEWNQGRTNRQKEIVAENVKGQTKNVGTDELPETCYETKATEKEERDRVTRLDEF